MSAAAAKNFPSTIADMLRLDDVSSVHVFCLRSIVNICTVSRGVIKMSIELTDKNTSGSTFFPANRQSFKNIMQKDSTNADMKRYPVRSLK